MCVQYGTKWTTGELNVLCIVFSVSFIKPKATMRDAEPQIRVETNYYRPKMCCIANRHKT